MIPTLKKWFIAKKRDLPWRGQPSPYAVWISEVMLQQTQVSVVIPYFQRWMERFPSIEELAAASAEEVIKVWEGLGYYSRARQIHAGAKWLVTHCQGRLPDSAEELMKIKGLGPYTVGAILSFAYHQKAAAVDGNVMRVLARVFLIEEDIGKTAIQKNMRALVLELLPNQEPWVVMEALIEFGATVCQKKPKCAGCPIQAHCLAFWQGRALDIPIKSAGVKVTVLTRYVSIIGASGALLVRKEEGKKVMADLYEFPYFENEEEQRVFHQAIGSKSSRNLPRVVHSFTRYRASLHPVLVLLPLRENITGFVWATWEELDHLPFSSGHRKILEQLKKEIKNENL